MKIVSECSTNRELLKNLVNEKGFLELGRADLCLHLAREILRKFSGGIVSSETETERRESMTLYVFTKDTLDQYYNERKEEEGCNCGNGTQLAASASAVGYP